MGPSTASDSACSSNDARTLARWTITSFGRPSATKAVDALRDEGGGLEDRTVFDTPEVFRTLTPRRVEMLEFLRHAEVASIQDLAAKLRRDYKNTYDDLAALKAWGLVAVLREGKNQRPVSHVTSLRVSWEK